MIDAPKVTQRARRTIVHKILDIESAAGTVTPQMYEVLDDVLTRAVDRLKSISPTTQRREDALAVLKEIDSVLTEVSFIYPAWDYVNTLAESLTPVELDADGLSAAIDTTENNNRRAHLQSHGVGVYYIADCDILSFLYLGIADALRLPLRFVERPQRAAGGPSHNFIRWQFADRTFVDWETMTGEERLPTPTAYVLSDGQVSGYVQSLLGDSWLRTGNSRRAVAAYRLSISRGYESAATLNQLAWYLSTDPDPSLRDPGAAMSFATRLCDGTPTAGQIDTCAAAAARYGDFAKAVEWQKKAIKGTTGAATGARMSARLALYQAKRAYTQVRLREQRAIEACDDTGDLLGGGAHGECPDPAKSHRSFRR